MDIKIDVEKDYKDEVKKYEKHLKLQQMQDFNNIYHYKTRLLNIDSTYRNKTPKNIYTTNNISLPNNPIIVTKGSNIVQINYPNHKFNINDNIIIQNVIGKSKTLANSIFFFNNFSYMFINYNNHGIGTDYTNWVENYQIYIEIINDIGSTTLYNNIPINAVIGVFNILLPSLLNLVTTIPIEILSELNANVASDLDPNWLLIKLPFNFIISGISYYIPTDIYKISFLSIGGISLPWINSDFPIDYQKYQSSHQIINIDTTNIYIQTSVNAGNTDQQGGSAIQIMLITNSYNGFPNANNYTLTLKHSFNNVVRIELISTEFPYIDFLIKNNSNNLYWQNYNDGNYTYQASIPEGNYDSTNLISKINSVLNSIETIGSTKEDPIYNIINVELNSYTQEITFSAFTKNKLPNSLYCSLVTINNITYVQLTVYHPGNLIEIGDNIIISGATKIGTIIDAIFINKTLTVYEVNISDQTYSSLLSPLNQITNLTEISITGNGGPGVVIQTKTKIRFLFNRNDTIGTILGFKNVGSSNAITPFTSVVSNFNDYVQSTNLNEVGNINTSKSILNLSGSNYYILMYLNDFECIINTSNQPICFAKILMSGNPGDVLFNTFINYPLEFDFPLPTLNELTIKLTYPDGSLVDFRNIDHSFTLRIVERIAMPYDTIKNSKDSSFYYETKKLILDKNSI